jgi:hypothetical protein
MMALPEDVLGKTGRVLDDAIGLKLAVRTMKTSAFFAGQIPPDVLAYALD